MHRHWRTWLAVGALALLGGIFALLDPLRNLELQVQAVTVVLEYFLGWLFILVGGGIALLAWHPRHAIRWRVLPVGVATFLVGLFLLLDPAGGERLMIILLALALIVSGLFKLLLGWEARPGHAMWWIMGTGAVSITVGAMVLAGVPATANLTLGLFLAIDMIATGVMMVILAVRHRHSAP